MNAFIYKLQALPERKRYLLMYSILASSTLIVFALVGISITARIDAANAPKPLPVIATDKNTASEQATIASPAQEFFKSFGSLKHLMINEEVIARESRGFKEIGAMARGYFGDAASGATQFLHYVKEKWLTRTISTD